MIVVIGGGMAGLSAARTLVREGRRDILVLEASSHPGGRVHTLEHDGFHLDAGFQVALDSYPAFRSQLPMACLDPCYFGSGALVEDRPGRLRCLAHPLRHPGTIGDALRSGLPWADRLRLGRLALECMAEPDARLLAEPGERTRLHLLECGFSDAIIEAFFEPFFGGVFLDAALETDSSLLRYYLKMFALGRAFLPRGGIGRLGETLAAALPPDKLRFGAPVARLEAKGPGFRVHPVDGDALDASAVIVATDPATACTLLDWPLPDTRHTRVVYFQSDRPVYDGKWLVLPSRKPRFAQHFVQLSNVDPTLAPDGRHLLSATVLDDEHLTETELYAAVKTEVTCLFPGTGPSLEPLRQIAVPGALPAQLPGFRGAYRRRADALPPNLRLAGDLAGHASLQNALESGHRAALAVLAS